MGETMKERSFIFRIYNNNIPYDSYIMCAECIEDISPGKGTDINNDVICTRTKDEAVAVGWYCSINYKWVCPECSKCLGLKGDRT